MHDFVASPLFPTNAFDDTFEFIATAANLIPDDKIEVETNYLTLRIFYR